MAKYRIILNDNGEVAGCQTIRERDGAVINIPASEGNRDWRQYLEWVAEGNTPDPMYTPEEEAENAVIAEVNEIRGELGRIIKSKFEMILAMFEVGKAKGLWVNTDFEQPLRTKAASWKQKLDRLKELGDDD
jgi:hypothetical protein